MQHERFPYSDAGGQPPSFFRLQEPTDSKGTPLPSVQVLGFFRGHAQAHKESQQRDDSGDQHRRRAASSETNQCEHLGSGVWILCGT
jgi:hypothetical protein